MAAFLSGSLRGCDGRPKVSPPSCDAPADFRTCSRIDEAHALGMRVAAHAHTAAGVDRALDAGVDSIEHGTLLEPAQSSRLVELGVTVAPTLLINNATRYLPSAEVALFYLVETVLGTLWVWWLLGETPGVSTLMGGAVVITVLVLHAWRGLHLERQRRPSPRPCPQPGAGTVAALDQSFRGIGAISAEGRRSGRSGGPWRGCRRRSYGRPYGLRRDGRLGCQFGCCRDLRYGGRPFGGGARPARRDAVAACSRMALAAGAWGYALVSDHAVDPPAGSG